MLDLGTIYGDISRGFLGSRVFVFLTHPDDVEVILNSSTHLDKSSDYNFFKPWLGDGLLISSGDKWRSHRKLIAPAFHQNVLKTFVDTFNENSVKTVNRLKKELGKVFDIHDYMSEATVDILLGEQSEIVFMKSLTVLNRSQMNNCYFRDRNGTSKNAQR